MALKNRKIKVVPMDAKSADLEFDRSRPDGTTMTTDQGALIEHTDDSLRPGARGPSLLEDFHLREKITRFDHERIPERVVHARGSAAHGVFKVYESLEDITKAGFLCDPDRTTPVFVRFSTVAGSRGSADTVRDVRGFATKFYTEEGNFDLVGNNMPVFFIQDGIKFPDFVHAVKPEPHHEMPQAASAHDSFWDFVSLVPETAHMVMWAMSDRAIPRSYRMMEGFGVHTFRLVNGRGKARFVKFHWKPLLGMHSLVWDEAQKIAGKDADFHRRDLWEAIDAGAYPEWELGLQVFGEAEAARFGFDILDATKLIPEEMVPVRRVGKLTLNRNPDNFFSETEQVAFCVSNVVPGIDFTDDPLLQARLFSYLDTQLTRLGGPNHAELPINRPIVAVHNHQQDGFHRQSVPTTRANYFPNSIGGGCPRMAQKGTGFVHFPEAVAGPKARIRSETFGDHFSQATMFLASQSPPEREHLIDACRFELAKVERKEIRERVVREIFARIDPAFAASVASGLGLPAPPAPSARAKTPTVARSLKPSPALSMANTPKDSIQTRQVAVLIADGVDAQHVAKVQASLERAGAVVHFVSNRLGAVKASDGTTIEANKTFLTAASVLFDAGYVPGGAKSVEALKRGQDAAGFLKELFRHAKTIGASGEGTTLVKGALAADLHGPDASLGAPVPVGLGVVLSEQGLKADFAKAFVHAIAQHRHWARASLVPLRT